MLTCLACFNTLEEYCSVMLQWWWFCRTQSLFRTWSGWSAWLKSWHKWQRGWWLVEQPACHWVHQQSEGMYSNLWRVSEKLPYTWHIYFIIHEFYGSSVSVYAAWCLAHRPMHHHNVCVIFHGIYSVKEVNVSVTVVCSSALIYNDTWSLLSFIMPHRLKHCLNLIHHHTLELSFTHPNTCSSIAHFWSHSKIQLKMINFDLQCWCGMALSHVYCHAGLPSHVKSCQVLKCGHNGKE